MTIQERILQVIENKEVTPYRFCKDLGLSMGYLDKRGSIGTDKYLKIIEYLPEINPEWLLTGKGSMLKEDNNLPMASKSANSEGIPLIPLDAMAGISSGEVSVLELDCERYVIPMFKGADFLIPVKGSSMIPKYNSGDVVACKKIPMQDLFFQWNKVYVLDTNQGALIKRIHKGPDNEHITLISENEKYTPFNLHLSQIYSVAIVVGVVRLE